MAKRSSFRSNFDGLKNLANSLAKVKQGRVQVGIFGAKNGRTDNGGTTNAEVGAVMEFGSVSEHIPHRSFLRMPITQKSEAIFKAAAQGFSQLMIAGKAKEFLVRIGVEAENAILEAFRTRGWGSWKPNAPMTIKLKGSDSPLIDTGQLRRSIASRVA